VILTVEQGEKNNNRGTKIRLHFCQTKFRYKISRYKSI